MRKDDPHCRRTLSALNASKSRLPGPESYDARSDGSKKRLPRPDHSITHPPSAFSGCTMAEPTTGWGTKYDANVTMSPKSFDPNSGESMTAA